MKKLSLLALGLLLASCASNQTTTTVGQTDSAGQSVRSPSATSDLTGTYLGEGLYSNRTTGIRRPAVRIYMDRAQGESDSYYGVIVEYDQLLNMGAPYLASQKAPVLNKVVGYLDKIATRISAYKFVPGPQAGTYNLHNLEVRNGQITPAAAPTMQLVLDPSNKSANPLNGAAITGGAEGTISFPHDDNSGEGLISGIAEMLNMSQYKLAKLVYKKGHLASTWRGNWQDLEGSYLSEYGRFKDGVLELYNVNGQKKAKFIKTNTTKAKYFTNPKSGDIEGDYIVSEPIPKMYLLIPISRRATPSDKEMVPRIGLFLDVFDGSAPEAGSHLVTELAFTNQNDPEDFMMYYEHPAHLKNVGVEPKK